MDTTRPSRRLGRLAALQLTMTCSQSRSDLSLRSRAGSNPRGQPQVEVAMASVLRTNRSVSSDGRKLLPSCTLQGTDCLIPSTRSTPWVVDPVIAR